MSDTIPQGGVSNPQSEAPRDPSQVTENVTQIQCGPKTLDRPQEAGFGDEA